MILLYHKIDIITPTIWWLTPGNLRRHIMGLRRFDFVYLDDYDPSSRSQVVLTFDDAYENVYRHAYPILRQERVPFEIFAIGGLLGLWNYFDSREPLTRFATGAQLLEMAAGGGRIQWHTHTHRNLFGLNVDQMEDELSPRDNLKMLFPEPHLRWFAYPYGSHDQSTVAMVKSKFVGAVSVSEGESNDRWQLNRIVVHENTVLPADERDSSRPFATPMPDPVAMGSE